VLFDLRTGKRRRVVQVVYSLLAVSFLIGFVLFGVGTGGLGSISDLFGGGGGSSTSSAYDPQINHAKAQLKKDPQDQQALLNLARYELLAGQTGVSPSDPNNPTQLPTVSDEGMTDFTAASDAWTRYLKVAKKPDPALATQVAGVEFQYLNDPAAAVRAQQIVADAQPSANTLGQLAIYEYASGNQKAGDAAAKQAVAKAPKVSRNQIKSQLASIKKQARKFFAAQKAAAKASSGSQGAGASQLQNPFSGLSPSGTPTTP